MKIILSEDVVKLGSLGDELEVKAGFARNYLIPQGKAVPLTRANIKQVNHQRALLAKQRADAVEQSKALAKKLEEVEVVFSMKSGDSGKLYGSVTQKHIYEALEEKGIEPDRKRLRLTSPIKTLGDHIIPIRLHTEVIAELKIQVKPEETVAEKPEGEETAEVTEAQEQTETPAKEAKAE